MREQNIAPKHNFNVTILEETSPIIYNEIMLQILIIFGLSDIITAPMMSTLNTQVFAVYYSEAENK